MALSDEQIEATKVPHGRNQFKVSDGGGLYLLVKSSGRYWKLAYRFEGKQKTLAFGVYPAVSLEEARQKRESAKELLAQNIDPGEIRKQERIELKAASQVQTASTAVEVVHRPKALNRIEQEEIELRRLSILQAVAASHAFTTNEAALQPMLESNGYYLSFDRLRTDLAWLYEQQAIDLKAGALWGIYLTQFGFDAVHGRMWIPGIKRAEAEVMKEKE
ncbi:prophage CP4-57 integrase [Mariprofundus micogutta]|uniref:Prophage CP4-57 integrase n=1 Tax=Mariprofundus micogutta TaxID=1921010 RepID=A0A1L8CRC0_9PROT|nr:Arm DNA-binding domain-containing protein [Mariprofundus micogutta]GAV21475.1 prophage CP4-57 integrase [Mariprofundus micogutta]